VARLRLLAVSVLGALAISLPSQQGCQQVLADEEVRSPQLRHGRIEIDEISSGSLVEDGERADNLEAARAGECPRVAIVK